MAKCRNFSSEAPSLRTCEDDLDLGIYTSSLSSTFSFLVKSSNIIKSDKEESGEPPEVFFDFLSGGGGGAIAFSLDILAQILQLFWNLKKLIKAQPKTKIQI